MREELIDDFSSRDADSHEEIFLTSFYELGRAYFCELPILRWSGDDEFYEIAMYISYSTSMKDIVHHIITSVDRDTFLTKKYFSLPTSSRLQRKIITSFAIMFLISGMECFIWHILCIDPIIIQSLFPVKK